MILQNEEVRAKIVDVARQIFSQFGFRKTTMEEIAAASRKGKSSIYYYFTSKEDIFKAVVEKEAEMLKSEVLKKVENIEDPVEKLKVYITARMRRLSKLTNFYSALKSDYLSHLEFIDNIRQSYDQEEVKIISDILQDGIDKGLFADDDPSLTAISIVTAMKGLEVPLLISKEHRNFESRMNNLISFLFYGIVKR
ncbi:MAG TPA: TetR/AcrR family transcriptional regulator [Bacteroidales bacterium]|nr:TetR/AcrR family transcriptional regulator [Bacteroidales bacterium]